MAVAKTSTSRINNFDLLRLLASTQVMVEHTIGYLKLSHFSGWGAMATIEGVPIFFVISGFLISASWKSSQNVRTYAIRRAGRIFPGLWCCILITTLTALAFGMNVPPVSGMVWFLAQLFGAIYTPDFLSSFGIGSYNTSLWTIPVELQFYIVIPLVYVALNFLPSRIGAAITFAIFVLISVVLYEIWLPPLGMAETGIQKLIRYSFIPHFYMFMAGVVIREFGVHNHFAVRGKALYWIAAYALFCGLVPRNPLADPIFFILGRLLLAITVISVAYTVPTLSSKVLRQIDLSYGVYIYHGLIINIVVMVGLSGSTEGAALVFLTVPLIAAGSWFLIEKPCLTLAHFRGSAISPSDRSEIAKYEKTKPVS